MAVLNKDQVESAKVHSHSEVGENCIKCNLIDAIADREQQLEELRKYAKEYKPESSKGCLFCESDNGKNRKLCGFCVSFMRTYGFNNKLGKEIKTLRAKVVELEGRVNADLLLLRDMEKYLQHDVLCEEGLTHRCNCGCEDIEIALAARLRGIERHPVCGAVKEPEVVLEEHTPFCNYSTDVKTPEIYRHCTCK